MHSLLFSSIISILLFNFFSILFLFLFLLFLICVLIKIYKHIGINEIILYNIVCTSICIIKVSATIKIFKPIFNLLLLVLFFLIVSSISCLILSIFLLLLLIVSLLIWILFFIKFKSSNCLFASIILLSLHFKSSNSSFLYFSSSSFSSICCFCFSILSICSWRSIILEFTMFKGLSLVLYVPTSSIIFFFSLFIVELYDISSSPVPRILDIFCIKLAFSFSLIFTFCCSIIIVDLINSSSTPVWSIKNWFPFDLSILNSLLISSSCSLYILGFFLLNSLNISILSLLSNLYVSFPENSLLFHGVYLSISGIFPPFLFLDIP